jgi:hypothetical protein
MHKIEHVDLVHHTNELNDMNEIAKTMKLCAIVYHCFSFCKLYTFKRKLAKKGAIKFPNHNTTRTTLIPREKRVY